MNAVTNGLHWKSIKRKPYGSLDRKRNYPSDKCSEKRQLWTEMICKEILNANTEPLELLDILICTLFNSKGDNFKIVQLQKTAIWDHGQIRKQTKRILNADTSEPHLRYNLVYSDREDNSHSNFHCFSIIWDCAFSEIWTRKTFSVFVDGCRVYSLA